jgi:6-phosphogluconolactonase (cycloisomerase 2 family)
VANPRTDGFLRRCASARIGSPHSIALSPDGRHLYAASSYQVAILSHDPRTGALAEVGCLQSALSSSELGCSEAPGLAAGLRAVDVSPDGRHVYVATTLAVVVLTRDEDSGALTQIVGTSGCVADSRVRAPAGDEAQPEAAELSDCAPADGIPAPSSLRVSPDGRHVYVASGPGDFDGSGSLGAFSRDPRTGALRQLGTTRTRDGAELLDATLTPDGRTLYAATFGNLAVFARDRTSGALRQLPGRAGCIDASSPCTWVPFSMAEVHVAVSPDGRSVYAANGALLSALSSREDGSLRHCADGRAVTASTHQSNRTCRASRSVALAARRSSGQRGRCQAPTASTSTSSASCSAAEGS